MKRQKIAFIAVLVLSMVFFGCMAVVGSADLPPAEDLPPATVSFPLFVENAINSAPDDVLVGIGTAIRESLSQARTIAASRARAEIARQMQAIIVKMVEDFEAFNVVDHADAINFLEKFSINLSTSALTDCYITDEDRDENDAVWNVTFIHKDDVKIELDEAVAYAKLAVPVMGSFEIESGFDEIFALVRAQALEVLLQYTL